jgi:release factor glutamine methyltransferase
VRTRADLLREAAARLRDAGVETPERDARLLMRDAAGLAPPALAAALGEVAGPGEAARFAAHVAARAGRRPVSRILGRRDFWGRSFRITPDVLDPRPETETLVAAALAAGPGRRILDLGTGSGILLVTLLAEWPEATGLGIDLSGAALAVAAANAAAHGVAHRAAFRTGDWLDGVAGPFDRVLANPPYVASAELAGLAPEVRLWDPPLALSPGGDGLGAYRRIASSLRSVLAPGGRAYLEIGTTQTCSVREILSEAGFCDVEFALDLNGGPRCAIVQG